jgi:hypothetical protein
VRAPGWRLQGLSGGALWSTGPAPRSPLDFARILQRVAVYRVVQATDWNYLLLLSKRPLGSQFLVLRSANDRESNTNSWASHSRTIVIGLWLCLEGVWHGNPSGGIFWVGPFLALVGGLWLVSHRFDF